MVKLIRWRRVRADEDTGTGQEDWTGLRLAVSRYVLSLCRDPDLAEDLAQQCVLRVIEYKQNNIVVSLYALAFRIAANLVREHYRRQKPSVTLEDAGELACEAPLPDQITGDRAETQALIRVLNAMPALRRTVFLRRRLDGQSCREIGVALGLSDKAVEKHITRAISDLHAARIRQPGGKGEAR